MTKKYSLLFACLLLLGKTTNACEADRRGYTHNEFLETQFTNFLKNDSQNPSLRFNQFVECNLFVLLHGPDDIEALNKQIKESNNPIPGTSHRVINDVTLKNNVNRSKRRHAALFDFVRKYKDTYAVNSELLADLKALEDFIAPIQCELGTYHNGQPISATNFLASDADSADKESLRITIFAQTEMPALAVALDCLPSQQAIKDLPAAVKKYMELQDKYRKFIQDYPHHKDRALHENDLTKLEHMLTTIHPEYLKQQPSKKEIERICSGEFLRKIGYGKALEERFNKTMQSKDTQKQQQEALEIIGIAESIKAYAEKYPTLDPEYSRILHKAADHIFSLFGMTIKNKK